MAPISSSNSINGRSHVHQLGPDRADLLFYLGNLLFVAPSLVVRDLCFKLGNLLKVFPARPGRKEKEVQKRVRDILMNMARCEGRGGVNEGPRVLSLRVPFRPSPCQPPGVGLGGAANASDGKWGLTCSMWVLLPCLLFSAS